MQHCADVKLFFNLYLVKYTSHLNVFQVKVLCLKEIYICDVN